MKRIVKKHSLAVRWFHWLNFPIIFVMIWSGLLIYWANDVYKLGWNDTTILKFFPDSFYKALNIPFKLAKGMSFHFFFMWLFAINGFLYVIYTIFSGAWKDLLPNRHSFKEAWQVLLHDLFISKKKTSAVKIQRRTTDRLYRNYFYGIWIAAHRIGDLQTNPVQQSLLVARRI